MTQRPQESRMISGLYSAATGMDAAANRHEVAAENLANIQAPGFRRRVMTQTTFEAELRNRMVQNRQGQSIYVGRDLLHSPYSAMLGTTVDDIQYDFAPGNYQMTNRPLDIAIHGDGFFTVQGPQGPLYTRSGAFHVNENGELITVDRLPVIGTNGPIILPADASTEGVRVLRDGRLMANGVEFGQLQIARFDQPQQLTAVGASLFAAPPNMPPEPSEAEIQGGSLELANTSAIGELTAIIQGTRQYEAAQKALTTIGDAVQRRIGLR
ncbi:MAG: flagellar hook basal-body protein [Planctomycetaceae bacterium]|nr:flagellar hook basal-body protein [Planctomycetaceae bacterium]